MDRIISWGQRPFQLVMWGCGQFVVLTIIAMLIYPGGTKFDPDATVPMPAGTFATHFGRQVHFDGAKTEDAVLLIVGEGPATATPAELK